MRRSTASTPKLKFTYAMDTMEQALNKSNKLIMDKGESHLPPQPQSSRSAQAIEIGHHHFDLHQSFHLSDDHGQGGGRVSRFVVSRELQLILTPGWLSTPRLNVMEPQDPM